ncbi:MAG TPA: M20/M25/M40 family metallo-hydrolase, partial [Elusimicrobiales bacterium]|nr:M20/M25/M40 family metallo-hydrolase [Elusimicrobiales bacterium]
DKAMWLKEELKKYKFDRVEEINATDPKAKNGVRPNIVAIYRGLNADKTVWIMSHLDIVPPGEMSMWKSDPYELVVDGDKLIGRGVEDNQQAIVASLIVAKVLMDNNIRPDYNLGLLFCADEETGSGFGADWVVEKRKDLFGPKDMFFVPDSGVEDGSMIEIAEKSILWLKVKTVGKQCHASRPQIGINAFKAASELVCKVEKLYKIFKHKDKLYE